MCQLICENTFNNLLRTTFLNLIDVDANDDTIRGLLYYSGEVFWLLSLYSSIAISSLFSLEIRDIVKNPFEAKTNNRKRYFKILFTLMLVFTPVIMILGKGRDTYFVEPDSTLNEYDANCKLFDSIKFLYKSFEIVIISNALYLSYIGIWKRDGLNKRVK